MTVTATARRAAYTGNNVTTSFAVPFQFLEIAVYKGGVLQTPGVHYTITQSSPGATGSVVFLAAPAAGIAVQIIGATVQAQTLDLLDNDSTPAELYERGLDRLTMITVENAQQFSQALRAPPFAAPLPELDFKNNPSSFPNTDSNGDLRLSPIDGPASPLAALVTAAQAAAASAQVSATNAEASDLELAAQLVEVTAARDVAVAAKEVAIGALDVFEQLYLGAKAEDPTTDNDGNPLIEGALYYNTVTGGLRAYELSGWVSAPEGPEGPPGPSVPGEAATVAVGTVTTLAPGASATVVNAGTSFEAVLNFGLPSGPGATVGIGTVTTLAAGAPATVTNSGTATAAVLNFGIPAGEDGAGSVSSVNTQTPTSGNITLTANHIDVAATPTNYTTADAKIESHLAGIHTALGLKSAKAANLGDVANKATSRINLGVGVPFPQGRLTLTAGVPILSTDVLNATALYYSPLIGDVVPLWDGTEWTVKSFVGGPYDTSGSASLTLDANAANPQYHQTGKVFDVFLFTIVGVLYMGTGPAWPTVTARGAGPGTSELEMLHGKWVNKQAIDLKFENTLGGISTVSANRATYVGTFATSANGQTEMSFKPTPTIGGCANKLYVYNAYNQVEMHALSREAANSWTYATATVRAANNSNANRISFVQGLGGGRVSGRYSTYAKWSVSTGAVVGVGYDSTSAMMEEVSPNFLDLPYAVDAFPMIAGFDKQLTDVGFHYVQALEWANPLGTVTFYGDNNLPSLIQTSLALKVYA